MIIQDVRIADHEAFDIFFVHWTYCGIHIQGEDFNKILVMMSFANGVDCVNCNRYK